MAFSGFGEYLDVKRSKVQLQNEALVADSGFEDSVQLFSGHVFYLNGYLTPNLTMLQFKTLLLKHGGTVKDYLASNTTLILASQMTDSKMRQLTKPVVKPDWALDCIQEKRTLPWRDYLLFQKDHDPKQASLLASFHRKPTNHCAELAGTDIEMVEDSDPEELDALPVPPRMPSIKEGQELDLTNEFVKVFIMLLLCGFWFYTMHRPGKYLNGAWVHRALSFFVALASHQHLEVGLEGLCARKLQAVFSN